MGLNKTEFLPGVFLSYPLESLPKLFAVVDTVSRKAFFEKIAELDKKGGEGLSIDKIIEMIWVGLQAETPGVTLDEARAHASQFYNEFGQEALELKLVDAFGDAKLTDKDAIEKRRNLLLELRDLELQRMEFMVRTKTKDLNEAESRMSGTDSGQGNSIKNLSSKQQNKDLYGVTTNRKRVTRTSKNQPQKKT
jgi:hypothetical protein